MQLTPREQTQVLMLEQRWSKLLDAGEGIRDAEVRQSTAVILENAQRDANKASQLNEAWSSTDGSMAAQTGGQLGTTAYASYGDNTDARVPTIVVPLLRRIFPNLIAHDLVGVQPLKNSPIGFVFALRAQYGVNRQFQSGNVDKNGNEIGFNNMDSTFAGASANVSGYDSNFWNAYAGSPIYGGDVEYNGAGADLVTSEWAKIGTNMPTANFKLVKATVEAVSRKLGASYSLELAEDLKNQHGIDADSEMTNILSYEIQAEIDRALITEMVKSAISTSAGRSTWNPASADGRHQTERIQTLYTQLLDKSNDIAARTRMGAGNFVVASPRVTALLQRVGAQVSVKLDDGNRLPENKVGTGAISRVGILADTHALYRDTFAGGNYALIGYKGPTAYSSGVVYAPYIPLQVFKAQDPNDGNPRLAVRTRDAIIGETGRPTGFEANKFYHFVKIDGLTDNVVGDASDGRVFMYA